MGWRTPHIPQLAFFMVAMFALGCGSRPAPTTGVGNPKAAVSPLPQLGQFYTKGLAKYGAKTPLAPTDLERELHFALKRSIIPLLHPASVWEAIAGLDSPALARHLHACSHTTFSPNVVHGGIKTNVIPDSVEIDVDIRTAPGDSGQVDEHLRDALGELFDEVEVRPIHDDPATFSSTDTPMWHLLQEMMQKAHPGAPLIPSLIVGATDARFYRDKGSVAYGAGLFSDRVNSSDFMARFHGHDERVDVDSLALTTQLWIDVVTNFWDRVDS